MSTCPSLKQRNVDASFKQMVLLGRKRCCLLAVICRPVDMPENFHLATYQLFYRRHWTQESIALGCTTKQGVEVGRYWLGGGANAHACLPHVRPNYLKKLTKLILESKKSCNLPQNSNFRTFLRKVNFFTDKYICALSPCPNTYQ